MSILSDKTIQTYCLEATRLVSPYTRDNLQPSSYELTLDGTTIYLAEPEHSGMVYDVRDRLFRSQTPALSLMGMSDETVTYTNDAAWIELTPDEDGTITLRPGRLYIASSIETLRIPNDLMAFFHGKSTLGRAGLMVHITAGYIDPGFVGTLTLEMVNVAPWAITLRNEDKIGQLTFHELDYPCQREYGSYNNHYQNQDGPTLPR